MNFWQTLRCMIFHWKHHRVVKMWYAGNDNRCAKCGREWFL